MNDVAMRLANRVQLTSDGHKAYLEAVEGAFGADIDYAMLIKIYGASSDSAKGRYSPADCTVEGQPDVKHISTSYSERSNLTMRMHYRRFTRLTNAFSKKFENHAHMVAIWSVWYNFIRIHTTLRVTPAMASEPVFVGAVRSSHQFVGCSTGNPAQGRREGGMNLSAWQSSRRLVPRWRARPQP